MRIAITVGGILIPIGSFLPWATFEEVYLLDYVEMTGLQIGHGVLTVLVGIGIVLLASDRARNVASRPRRAGGLLALVALLALFPSFSYFERALPWILIGAGVVLMPTADAIRSMASRPGRSTLLLVLVLLVDLIVLGMGFELRDGELDGRAFWGVGLGLIIVVAGAAIAAIAAWRLEKASTGRAVTVL
jgi:hypothetical protein